MARLLFWVPVVLVLAVPAGNGAPVRGPVAMTKVRIGGKLAMEFKDRYEGGRRACVIAVGDHNPPVDIAIAVYDDTDQLLVEQQGLDYVAAIWYPPRAAAYKVVVRNSGLEYNEVYIVFK